MNTKLPFLFQFVQWLYTGLRWEPISGRNAIFFLGGSTGGCQRWFCYLWFCQTKKSLGSQQKVRDGWVTEPKVVFFVPKVSLCKRSACVTEFNALPNALTYITPRYTWQVPFFVKLPFMISFHSSNLDTHNLPHETSDTCALSQIHSGLDS